MRIMSKLSRDSLVKQAASLNFSTQESLRFVEDEFAKKFYYNVFDERCSNDVLKYLALTSLPFIFENKKFNLKKVWDINCRKCNSVIFRKTMPTGNLMPTYFLIGDAPGVGDGELKDKFDRVWVYGPSSHLLRKALLGLGIYYDCWLTNLLKCSTPKNRPSTKNEVSSCIQSLEIEIKLLKPKVLILLGRNVQNKIPDFGIKTINVYHPSYYVRNNWSYKKYSELLKEALL